MKHTHPIIHRLASVCACFFSLALIVCANTSSSFIVHQERAPKELCRYSLLN